MNMFRAYLSTPKFITLTFIAVSGVFHSCDVTMTSLDEMRQNSWLLGSVPSKVKGCNISGIAVRRKTTSNTIKTKCYSTFLAKGHPILKKLHGPCKLSIRNVYNLSAWGTTTISWWATQHNTGLVRIL